MEVGIREAKTKLSQLVKAVLEGEEVSLTNRGQRKVQLTVAPYLPSQKDSAKGWGSWAGKINFYPGWDSPEEDERIANMFEYIQEENEAAAGHKRTASRNGSKASTPRRKAAVRKSR